MGKNSGNILLTRIGGKNSGFLLTKKKNFSITFIYKSIVQKNESAEAKILAAKKQDKNAETGAWERGIDELVYKLYDLTEEEIKIIEGGK